MPRCKATNWPAKCPVNTATDSYPFISTTLINRDGNEWIIYSGVGVSIDWPWASYRHELSAFFKILIRFFFTPVSSLIITQRHHAGKKSSATTYKKWNNRSPVPVVKHYHHIQQIKLQVTLIQTLWTKTEISHNGADTVALLERTILLTDLIQRWELSNLEDWLQKSSKSSSF